MRVLVTGSGGFVGRNLRVSLARRGDVVVDGFDIDTPPEALAESLAGAELIFHLAGVNRPDRAEAFDEVNYGLTRRMLDRLGALDRRPTIVFSSSSQAELPTAYGASKRAAEEALSQFAAASGAAVRIYRLPGVFGRWCRPNYNSVVATFCHNIARGLPIQVTDPARAVALVHVSDVIAAFEGELSATGTPGIAWRTVAPTFSVTLGRLEDLLRTFHASRETLSVPDFSDPFLRRLYATYQAYLPDGGLAYDLRSRADDRGVLAELLRSPQAGQIFVSRTRPGVTRGNHYHDLKVEKFFVVQGDAVVRFRPVEGGAVTAYRVSGERWQALDIPPGHTHSIENVGSSDLVVLFWASEPFDPSRPDTFGSKVIDE